MGRIWDARPKLVLVCQTAELTRNKHRHQNIIPYAQSNTPHMRDPTAAHCVSLLTTHL